MITTYTDFREGMLRDIERWQAEMKALGPDPMWEPTRRQIQAWIDEGRSLLAPL
jgi:hypothetical protein